MRILRLRAQNFRLLGEADLPLDGRHTVILGDNAAGKTTVLETLFLASRGRPLIGQDRDVCGAAGDHWSVQVTVEGQPDRPPSIVAMRYASRVREQRIDGDVCGQSALARQLPLAFLGPRSHAVLNEGPAHRRRYLDWGMFHVEPSFPDVWRRYRRALRQRNVALRVGANLGAIRPWTEECARTGSALAELRNRHLANLVPVLLETLQRVVGDAEWSVTLRPGWDDDQSLLAALIDRENEDRRQKMTTRGPHRAELHIGRAQHSARLRVSRGEEKLVVAALVAAQLRLMSGDDNPGIWLIDDFASELGAAAQARLADEMSRLGAQVLLTALQDAAALQALPYRRVFHVEHGVLRAVVN